MSPVTIDEIAQKLDAGEGLPLVYTIRSVKYQPLVAAVTEPPKSDDSADIRIPFPNWPVDTVPPNVTDPGLEQWEIGRPDVYVTGLKHHVTIKNVKAYYAAVLHEHGEKPKPGSKIVDDTTPVVWELKHTHGSIHTIGLPGSGLLWTANGDKATITLMPPANDGGKSQGWEIIGLL